MTWIAGDLPTDRPARNAVVCRGLRTLVAIVVVALAAAGCMNQEEPGPTQKARIAESLAAGLPLLDELGVEAYRDWGWSRSLSYSGGCFATRAEDSLCRSFNGVMSEGRVVDFTFKASRAFSRIQQAFQASGVPVRYVYVDGWSGATEGSVTFYIEAGSFDRWSYVYDPGYGSLEDYPVEGGTVPINADWFFVWDDWN